MLVENATSPWGQSLERVFHKHSCIQFIALVLVENPFPRLSPWRNQTYPKGEHNGAVGPKYASCSNNRSFFFTEADKAQLNRIQIAVCSMRDLRQLFLLLIRHYNPAIQTRQYLNDVICANHVLLVLIENTDIGTNIMTSHLQQ